MRFASYDINVNDFPLNIDWRPHMPQIYFFPAFSKQVPFRRYDGGFDAGTIMKFIFFHNDIVKMKNLSQVNLTSDNDLYNYVEMYKYFS